MDRWRSYDDVAETYERIHAPRLSEPARDLVEIAQIGEGTRVLDVGTGTGVAAEIAMAAGADVMGIDGSLGMLRVGRAARPSVRTIAATALDLPFRDADFDGIIANFVIAHFTKYQTALFDMVRVLRRGGRMSLTAWADIDDDLTRTWLELVEGVVPREVLSSAMAEALPWRERFRNREAVQEALTDAGLRTVRTEVRRYRFRYGLDEYVEGLGTWATGRFVRSMLGPAAFESFHERAKRVFAERFADPVNDFREVVFATGVKP
jgi:ubiquinone/menaquinone biosynthesis C-methylase UbiE